MRIKLNCDMGEGLDKIDKQVMPYIDMTNLACGFHAGDEFIMNSCVKMATKYKVKIGAHPGYNDKKNFGRQSIPCTNDELEALVLYQIGALNAICKAHNTKITYVKPHGALYNDMMVNQTIFKTIVKTIHSYNKKLKLMILSSKKNKSYKKIANKYNIKLIYEVFADRNYTDDGFLVSRSNDNAVIFNTQEVVQRVKKLQKDSTISSENGKTLKLEANSICVHGDNKKAVKFIKTLKVMLNK